MDQIERLPPNVDIAPQKSVVINPGPGPIIKPLVAPDGNADFGATNVPEVTGTLPTVHTNPVSTAGNAPVVHSPTLAARVSLADRIAHASSIVPVKQEPFFTGGQLIGQLKPGEAYQHVANLSKSFPSNEIHTILKLKGMDAQQAEQAL